LSSEREEVKGIINNNSQLISKKEDDINRVKQELCESQKQSSYWEYWTGGSKATNEFLLEKNNNKNSITVNNLIFFQQFQAYLKHERFNYSEALENALKYEARWK
jgi:hypothetical protein